MFIKSAKCGNCGQDIPTFPGFKTFRCPPHYVACPKCQAKIKTSFAFRNTWTFHLLCKIFCLPAMVVIAIMMILAGTSKGEGIGMTLFVSAFFSLIMGGGGGAIAAILASIPVQLVFDVLWMGTSTEGINQ